MSKNINSDEFKEIIDNGNLVVVDFHASWCGPCKMLGPIIDELSNEYNANEKVEIVKMDVDSNTDTALNYSVRGVPTILFIKNGEVLDRLVGLKQKSEIRTKIEELV